MYFYLSQKYFLLGFVGKIVFISLQFEGFWKILLRKKKWIKVILSANNKLTLNAVFVQYIYLIELALIQG